MNMICPLCKLGKDEFHKKSHIVPEWMYRDIYDAEHEHKMVNADFDKEVVNKEQTGYYEEYIICKDCENESQLYDSYACRILTDRAPQTKEHRAVTKIPYKKSKDGRIVRFSRWEGIDFLKFQKFVFATALKGHLATVKHGKTILGKKHFEQMRQLYKKPLLMIEPTQSEWYSFLMTINLRIKLCSLSQI